MNLKSLYIIAIPFFLSGDSISNALAECCGRCVGSANCTACTTCNYCKHCNSGGSCGVCGGRNSFRPESNYRTHASPNYSSPNSYNSKKKDIQYFVNTNLLNVRMGPGTNFKVLDKISYYSKVKVESDLKNGWCYIKYVNSNGFLSYGYVVTKYLSYYSFSK